MEYKVQLYTYENGDFVKKESTATRYYSLSPYLDGDDDGDDPEPRGDRAAEQVSDVL